MAYTDPVERGDGYKVPASEWNKNTVNNPAALRTGALAIVSQTTGDVIVASSATQLTRVAPAASGTVLTSNGAGVAPSFQNRALASTACGRLTLTSATPVLTSDVTAATTLYYALYGGNQIALYNGTNFETFTIAELSIAVPSTTDTAYDVFVDYNSGTPALSLTAWTNLTTRATALTTQDGIYVLTGSTGKRYVGSFRTGSVSGQTEDSKKKRYVWNYANRLSRPVEALDATNSWSYTAAIYQQANASTANQVEVMVGVVEEPMDLSLIAYASNGGTINVWGAIGYDSTTVPIQSSQGVATNSTLIQLDCRTVHFPAIGAHTYTWLERSTATGTTTWYGDNGDDTLVKAGLRGVWRG